MKFSHIEMLFMVWTLPFLFLTVVYGMKRRRQILTRFASLKTLNAIAPETNSRRRWVKASLVLLSLMLITLALSGPQYGYKWEKVEQKGVDIIVALDLSRSMTATDIQPSRLERGKREIYDLLGMLKGDRMGLVAFAGTAFLQCPLTLDYEAFHIFLNSLTPDVMPVGGTNLSEAVTVSLSAFDPITASQKAVILITDGENTGNDDPVKAAEQAQKAGVKLFCIGVGSEEGVPIPAETGGITKDTSGKIVLSRLDEEMLKKMAAVTGGTFVRSVSGGMDLDVIYNQEIRGKMDASTVSSSRKQIWEDRFQWVLALAVLALAADLFIPTVRKLPVLMVLACLTAGSMPVHAGENPLKEGIAAYNSGSYEKALKFFIDAQLDHPDRPDILYNIGNTQYHLGNYDAAAQNYQQALKSENRQLKEKALYNLGNTDFRKKSYEEAIKQYDEALKLDPADTQARQNEEYVQKVMEQIKQQQNDPKNPSDQSEQKDTGQDQKKEGSDKKQQPDKDKDSDQGNKAQDGKNQPQQADENKTEKNPSSPDAGKEKENAENRDDQTSRTQQENSGNQQKQEVHDSGSSGGTETPDEKQQAERILNRLQDQPGKAMIPAYGKTQVEKDW